MGLATKDNAIRGRGGDVIRQHDGARPTWWSEPTGRIQRCNSCPSSLEENFVRRLGGYNAWFIGPDTVGLDSWFMYQAPGKRNISIRPTDDRTIANIANDGEPAFRLLSI